jgi:aspartate kinase
VPVKLLNTMAPLAAGTVIQKAASRKGVKAIAAKDGIVAINIKSSRMLLAYGFLRKIFEVFEKYKTPIDMVTTSEVAVSVTIDNGSQLKQILRELEPFGTTEVETDQTIVSIVGNEIVETKDVLNKLFEGLSNIPVRMVSYGGSKHNVSVLIPSSYRNQTLQNLNTKLFGLE